MIGQDDFLFPELPSSPIGNELSSGLGISSLTSPRGNTGKKMKRTQLYCYNSSVHHLCACIYTGRLNKIDDEMKKLLNDNAS